MGRLLTTRRSEWLPGIGALAASVGVAATLGISFGVRNWAAYAGLAALFLLLSALARRRAGRPKGDERRPRQKPKPGRRTPPAYDLASDQSTDNQKYLM